MGMLCVVLIFLYFSIYFVSWLTSTLFKAALLSRKSDYITNLAEYILFPCAGAVLLRSAAAIRAVRFSQICEEASEVKGGKIKMSIWEKNLPVVVLQSFYTNDKYGYIKAAIILSFICDETNRIFSSFRHKRNFWMLKIFAISAHICSHLDEILTEKFGILGSVKKRLTRATLLWFSYYFFY